MMPVISEEEWEAFGQLCTILRPFEEMTTEMSGEKYVTGGNVIVATRILKDTCEELYKMDNILPQITAFIGELDKYIDERFDKVEKSGSFSLCTFLDPRFKMAAFKDQSEAAKTKRRVQDKVQEMIARQRQEVPAEPFAPSNKKTLSAWDVFDKFMSDKITSQQGTPLSKAIKEVQMYAEDDILLRVDSEGNKNCPRKWWAAHRHIYPNLAHIYRTNCNIVASSVPCERLFSKTGLIISDRRSSLKSDKVRQLMFLNVNLD
ncbi:zinc finger BED domain-containing protein 4-like [Leguminivora glycinivorella]|uniref:zinc finger BED domain-containing protein 4-like n=1 Tax=Leguminivora glycinivorella TaxID=1035111 RepID=UPI00200E347C|nr:zinc finger BED domain-containing protein 4-like [Leguminivora glycinivorella]